MNDLLKQRILRRLDELSDERGYQILDYIEFLHSKYAERAAPGNIFAKFTETVEDTMRAGKLPIQAISGTMGIMDSAAKLMRGVAAAGQAVVDEAVKASSAGGDPGSSATPRGAQQSQQSHASQPVQPAHSAPAQPPQSSQPADPPARPPADPPARPPSDPPARPS